MHSSPQHLVPTLDVRQWQFPNIHLPLHLHQVTPTQYIQTLSWIYSSANNWVTLISAPDLQFADKGQEAINSLFLKDINLWN